MNALVVDLMFAFNVNRDPWSLQALDAVVGELATLEGQMREIAAQVEPFKAAKEAAKRAHKVKKKKKHSRIISSRCRYRLHTLKYPGADHVLC